MATTLVRGTAPSRPWAGRAAGFLTQRGIPAVAFLVMDVLVARLVVHNIWVATSNGLTVKELFLLASMVVYLAFVSLVIMLFLVRPRARAHDARVSSWALAMLGTFGLLVAPLLPGGPILFHTGIVGEMGQSVVIVLAMALALTTLHVLGHSFSLTPQARSLVSHGPYRLVRHPLYLCESLAILCLVVASGETTTVLVAAMVLCAQVRRAQLEERLLSAAFPEYEDVFRGVPHFLPGLY